MHEMGIAMEIVRIATSSIPDTIENIRVKSVNLKIGKMAAVVPESLSFCFDIATKETPLSGAKLNIEEIPAVARCKLCDNEWSVSGLTFNCTSCNSGSIDILSGRELEIVSIDVEDD
jgi:hydrogenase nickel incorporation protein HypA/HybF